MVSVTEKTEVEILQEEISKLKELTTRQAELINSLSKEKNRLYDGIRSNPIAWNHYSKIVESPLTDNTHALELIKSLLEELAHYKTKEKE